MRTDTVFAVSAAVLGCTATLVVWAAGTELETLSEPRPAPDFELQNLQGESRTLEDYRGKVVVVNFWAIWCAPCVKEMPSMQRLWEQTRDQGVVMLALNWGDSVEDVGVFFDQRLKTPVDFPVLLGADADTAEDWGMRGLPTTYVLDPQGRIVYKAVGEREWDHPDIIQRILALTEK